MTAISTENSSLAFTINRLSGKNIGFSAAYMDIQFLSGVVEKSPESITMDAVDTLLNFLGSSSFDHKKQGYFLFKDAACALIGLSIDRTSSFAAHIINTLQTLVFDCSGARHRALSEALGTLPLNIHGPALPAFDPEHIIEISYEDLIRHVTDQDINHICWQGRTLVLTYDINRKICIKFVKAGESPDDLATEISWLSFLCNNRIAPSSYFNIPVPVVIDRACLFRMKQLPNQVEENQAILNPYTAICFKTHEHYFHYANHPNLCENDNTEILDMFARNAWLSGKLSSKGIIHTALIPLFHNRAQGVRRDDQGLYNWQQGGRLDQWLSSSQYPNFSRSGLRDFEHMISVSNTKQLHHFIGDHILSFILVAGSFFRNIAPEEFGFDANGIPVDKRELFIEPFFIDMIKVIISNYYSGLTGVKLQLMDQLVDSTLVRSLIQAMGQDNHMEEILRVQDQENMSAAEFRQFLSERNIPVDTIKKTIQSDSDIVLYTGPHLGGFNQPISVPELIEMLFRLSSVCISDCFLIENGLKADLI